MGIISIFIAYCLKLYEQKDKINIKQLLILVGIVTLIGTLKSMAYIPIALIIFILPVIKIIKENKKHIVLIALLVIISCLMNLFITYELSKETVSDTRMEGTDAGAQISYIRENPKEYTKTIYNHTRSVFLRFEVLAFLNAPMFFGTNYSQVFLLLFLFVLYVSIIDDSKNFNRKTKGIFILTCLLTFIITSTMLYISYTKVGNDVISGYQSRYIYPMIPLLLMCFSSDKVKIIVDKDKETVKISYISIAFIVLSIIGMIF